MDGWGLGITALKRKKIVVTATSPASNFPTSEIRVNFGTSEILVVLRTRIFWGYGRYDHCISIWKNSMTRSRVVNKILVRSCPFFRPPSRAGLRLFTRPWRNTNANLYNKIISPLWKKLSLFSYARVFGGTFSRARVTNRKFLSPNANFFKLTPF